MYSFYELLWIFFIYAFLGWCSEVVFAAVKTGEFVNRGFLIGPVCPIYGFGVAFVLLALQPFGDSLLILFVASVIITSALELLVGWLAEKLLHQRLWDYSQMPFNFKGYICLAFSLLWGLACILVVRVIHPLIMTLIGWIPHTLGIVLLCILGALFVTDITLTLFNALKLPKQIKAAEELARMIRSMSDNIGESLYDSVTKLDLPEKKEALDAKKEAFDAKRAESKEARETKMAESKEAFDAKRAELAEKMDAYRKMVGKNRTYHRLVKAFPHLTEERHHHSLETIREYLQKEKREKRDKGEKEAK